MLPVSGCKRELTTRFQEDGHSGPEVDGFRVASLAGAGCDNDQARAGPGGRVVRVSALNLPRMVRERLSDFDTLGFDVHSVNCIDCFSHLLLL